jgi:hypothetical protein
MMTPALTKANLTAHIATSVAWAGAVACFLVLSVAGLTSRNADTVRGAYLAMNLVGTFVIVPLSLAALLTGVIQSVATPWGLLRYYWVATKLVLTIGATLLLMVHQFSAVAGAARRVSVVPAGIRPEVGQLGIQLVGEAGFAMIALLVITTLSVYKPWGPTRYGLRQQRNKRSHTSTAITIVDSNETSAGAVPLGLKILVATMGLMLAVFGFLHHGGSGLHGH